jgi:hypothetical protein
MRFSWRGPWRKGEILIEAESLAELTSLIDSLISSGETPSPQREEAAVPILPPELGCSDAIKELIGSEWGIRPRTMAELKKVLESNALYFSKGTLSGTLRFLSKRGDIRRFKKAGKWVYIARER